MILFALLYSLNATAVEQRELTLLPKCEAQVREAVTKAAGQDDETFTIVGIKLLYGGSVGGLHFDPVVLVRTSDEVEPRDFIVITTVSGSAQADKVGCRVRTVTTVADGLLPEIEGL